MKSKLPLICLVLAYPMVAQAQFDSRSLDNVPVETFELPSEQFKYGTFINDVRTRSEQSHLKTYGSCGYWTDNYRARYNSPECKSLREKVSSSALESRANPQSDQDWALIRQRFECGESSSELIDLATREDTPRGLFRDDEQLFLKDLKMKRFISQISAPLNHSGKLFNRGTNYRCVAPSNPENDGLTPLDSIALRISPEPSR